MSIGFDPIVSSFLFSASLIPHAARPKRDLEMPTIVQPVLPFVSVIVALYREKWSDIEMTLQSLVRQTYPKDKFEVLIAIEARDRQIQPHAQAAAEELREAGLAARIIISDG